MERKNIKAVVYGLQEIMRKATIFPKRNSADFFADRLRIAATAGDLMALLNRFGELLGSPVLSGETAGRLLKAAASTDAQALFAWLSEQPKTAVALCYIKSADLDDVLAAFVRAYKPKMFTPASIPRRRQFDIGIRVTMEQPLVHGDDRKAGNSTLFRRAMIRGGAELPYYAANAFAGQMRDLLAADFLDIIGIDIRKPHQLQVWFYHLLFSGGVMADGAIPKTFEKVLAGSAAGSLNVSGTISLRNMLPFFSLLGGVGKVPIDSRIYINDLRPECAEWGNGEEAIASLMDWRFITRRDDYEDRISRAQLTEQDEELCLQQSIFGNIKTEEKAEKEMPADAANTSMIVNYEVLVEGTRLEGGIDLSRHINETESSCLMRGLRLMADYGYLGGKRRRGFGRCLMEYIFSKSLPEEEIYVQYLADNRGDIMEYLARIGALVERG